MWMDLQNSIINEVSQKMKGKLCSKLSLVGVLSGPDIKELINDYTHIKQ